MFINRHRWIAPDCGFWVKSRMIVRVRAMTRCGVPIEGRAGGVKHAPCVSGFSKGGGLVGSLFVMNGYQG